MQPYFYNSVSEWMKIRDLRDIGSAKALPLCSIPQVLLLLLLMRHTIATRTYTGEARIIGPG